MVYSDYDHMPLLGQFIDAGILDVVHDRWPPEFNFNLT